jgi:hypothetical protein
LVTAKVILEQNIDPGWFVCPLAPTLEQGGMWGGGRYHNSVKTGIFKNSVIHQMISYRHIQYVSGCIMVSRQWWSMSWWFIEQDIVTFLSFHLRHI